MDVQSMRVRLERKYGRAFVKNKKDDQIIAIFRQLQSKNKI